MKDGGTSQLVSFSPRRAERLSLGVGSGKLGVAHRTVVRDASSPSPVHSPSWASARAPTLPRGFSRAAWRSAASSFAIPVIRSVTCLCATCYGVTCSARAMGAVCSCHGRCTTRPYRVRVAPPHVAQGTRHGTQHIAHRTFSTWHRSTRHVARDGLDLGDLPPGRWRNVSKDELRRAFGPAAAVPSR